MKKYLAICCLLFVGFVSCKSTEHNMFSVISGQVVDYDTRQGISKATVFLNLRGGGKNTMTDSNGHFEFTDLDPQGYRVTAQKKDINQIGKIYLFL